MILSGHKFDGEEATEDLNVILKLRTMTSQPEVEINAGVYWWIDPQHLIRAVKHWKIRGHPCLRGIRFSDVIDWESRNKMTKSQRRENEEKVFKSWKHLTSKPHEFLEIYHKKFLEENDIASEEDVQEKFPDQQF